MIPSPAIGGCLESYEEKGSGQWIRPVIPYFRSRAEQISLNQKRFMLDTIRDWDAEEDDRDTYPPFYG